MKFTFWAVIVPFLLNGVELLMRSHADPLPFGFGFSVLITIWFWGGCVCAFWYWIVRLVRRAWGDGDRQASTRPAGWIYPNQR